MIELFPEDWLCRQLGGCCAVTNRLRSPVHAAQATISALTLHARLAYPRQLWPVTLDHDQRMKTETKEEKQTLTSWQPVWSRMILQDGAWLNR